MRVVRAKYYNYIKPVNSNMHGYGILDNALLSLALDHILSS